MEVADPTETFVVDGRVVDANGQSIQNVEDVIGGDDEKYFWECIDKMKILPTPTLGANGKPRAWRLQFNRVFLNYSGDLDKVDLVNHFHSINAGVNVYASSHSNKFWSRDEGAFYEARGFFVMVHSIKRLDWGQRSLKYRDTMPTQVYILSEKDVPLAAAILSFRKPDEYPSLTAIAQKRAFKASTIERIINAKDVYDAAAIAGGSVSNQAAAMRVYAEHGSKDEPVKSDKPPFELLHPFQSLCVKFFEAEAPLMFPDLPESEDNKRMPGRKVLFAYDSGEYYYVDGYQYRHAGGHLGKSMFTDYCKWKYGKDFLLLKTDGKASDLKNIITRKDWSGKYLVIDLARSSNANTRTALSSGLTSMIEDIQDGHVDSGKYEGRTLNATRGCRVIVFTNRAMDARTRAMMSDDRWLIVNLWARFPASHARAGQLRYVDWQLRVDSIKRLTMSEENLVFMEEDEIEQLRQDVANGNTRYQFSHKAIQWWKHDPSTDPDPPKSDTKKKARKVKASRPSSPSSSSDTPSSDGVGTTMYITAC